jgi:xanthine/uracil permease
MKKNNFTSWQGTAAVGGLSTIVISYLQFGTPSLTPEAIKLYTAITPVVSGGVVAVVNWLLAAVGVGSVASIRIEKINNKRLKKLETQIERARSLGVPTDKLEAQYQHAVIAADKVSEQQVIAITTGE